MDNTVNGEDEDIHHEVEGDRILRSPEVCVMSALV